VTIWEGRISPVADLTRGLLVVDIGGQNITSRHHEHFDNDSLFYRARKLYDLGVKTFICGAISDFYGGLVEGYGIRLIPFVYGGVENVLKAFLNNTLVSTKYLMRNHFPHGMRKDP
jgi:predicted Fe-Mo cluster-binding NifX family protein